MIIYRDHRKQLKRLQADTEGRRSRRRPGLLIAIGLAVSPIALGAAPLQGHDEIRQAAQAFLADHPPAGTDRIETSVGHLDSRLRLVKCGAPLAVSRPAGSRSVGRTTLEVRCTTPKAWKLLLPVHVRVFGDVVTAARTLSRGTVLRKEDIVMQERELSRLGYGYIARLDEAVGKELRRAVRTGTTLTPAQLAAQRLVRRGQRVTILANAGGIEVRMVGEALADGARDELIRVRNRKTKRIVEGIVESSGVVRVNL